MKTGFHRGAVLALGEAIELQPNYPEAHYNLGLAHLSLRAYQAAIPSFRVALEQSPKFQDALRRLAGAYEGVADTTNAVAAYTRLALEFKDVRGHIALGRIYSNDEVSLAIRHYEMASRLDSTSQEVRSQLGDLYTTAGNTEAAVAVYRKMLVRRPEDLDLLRKLASVHHIAGQWGRAATVYERLKDLRSDDVQVLYNLGLVYDRMGAPEKAILAYKEAIEVDPQHANAHLNLAIDLVETRQYEDALQAYERFLALAGDHEKRKQVEEIVKELRSALGDKAGIAE